MLESTLNYVRSLNSMQEANADKLTVLYEDEGFNNSFLSQPSLSKDWLRKEEDAAWQNL